MHIRVLARKRNAIGRNLMHILFLDFRQRILWNERTASKQTLIRRAFFKRKCPGKCSLSFKIRLSCKPPQCKKTLQSVFYFSWSKSTTSTTLKGQVAFLEIAKASAWFSDICGTMRIAATANFKAKPGSTELSWHPFPRAVLDFQNCSRFRGTPQATLRSRIG